MPRKAMHPFVERLMGLGMQALDAGLRAAADTLLEAGENVSENVKVRVKRTRENIKGEPVVEGEPRKRPKKKSKETS